MTRRSRRHWLSDLRFGVIAAGLGLAAGLGCCGAVNAQTHAGSPGDSAWLQSELIHSGFVKAAAVRPASGNDDIINVRLGGNESQTRVVMDLDRSTEGDAAISADGRALVLALSHISVRSGQKGTGKGLISSWALEGSLGGNLSGGKLRLNFNAPIKVMRRFVLPPADGVNYYRYVIDIVPKSQSGPMLASASSSTSFVPLKAEITSPPPDPRRKKVIVIDAGHGGKDPGASGRQVIEKNINLAAARALRDQLVATGRYRVIMTRETDSFVDLPARVRIARDADADLFISLHSDSTATSSVRGASIYTLSDSGTERAAKKALALGDWSYPNQSADHMVERILIDLTQRATKNRSAIFAQLVLDRLEGTMPLLRTSNRQAGFAVLLAPDVPAVLLEMGFVNQSQDEALLADPDHRIRMMSQVAHAIDAYFDSQKRGPTLAILP